MLDVPDVQLDSLLPRNPGSAVDLGPAGYAGAQIQAAELARRVELDLCRQGRARPDDAHIASQHVEEVRQLVEREAAQEPPDAGDAWVLGRHRGADADRVGAPPHGAQLEHLEDHAVPSDPTLAVEHRPAGGELDGDGGREEDRRDEDEGDDGDGEIGPAGEPLLRASRGRRHVQSLLVGVRHGPIAAAHRVPSTFSQPIGTDPARSRSQSPTAIEAVTVT
jgi:hypothetical protein